MDQVPMAARGSVAARLSESRAGPQRPFRESQHRTKPASFPPHKMLKTILVVGAGLSGLVTAIACAKRASA